MRSIQWRTFAGAMVLSFCQGCEPQVIFWCADPVGGFGGQGGTGATATTETPTPTVCLCDCPDGPPMPPGAPDSDYCADAIQGSNCCHWAGPKQMIVGVCQDGICQHDRACPIDSPCSFTSLCYEEANILKPPLSCGHPCGDGSICDGHGNCCFPDDGD